MTIAQRVVLLLLALPFSALLAAGVYWMLDIAAAYRLAAAVLVFVASEFVLHRLGAKIRSPVGADAIPGREAEVMTNFEPDEHGIHTGHVGLDGVRWRARMALSEGAAPTPGTRVCVVRVEGLTLWVSTVSRPTNTDGQ